MRAQVGQINVNSSLFSGAPINGVQLIPEQGLAQDTQGVTINGIARTHQARVEVRQSGQIIYTAPVNAGAFTLKMSPSYAAIPTLTSASLKPMAQRQPSRCRQYPLIYANSRPQA